jgi:hypothetical protein
MGGTEVTVTIFIKTSGGGGIVLLVACILIFGRGGGISGTLAAVLAGLVALVVLAIIVSLVILVRRLLPGRQPEVSKLETSVVRVVPEPGRPSTGQIGQYPAPALDAPVRLPQDQLEQLAELIRRQQRPE